MNRFSYQCVGDTADDLGSEKFTFNRIDIDLTGLHLPDPKRKELDRAMRKSLYAKMEVSKYPARYVSLCCRCLIEGKISRGVFANYLGIDRADIDSYLNKFGFRENNYEEIVAA